MRCTNPYTNERGAFPCGQCLPCRINRRRMWMHRMLLESVLHPYNSFITLTYRPEDEPPARSLEPKDLQDWLKRFRKSISPMRVRFYAAGEYGEETERPHYHIAMFNYPGCVYGQSQYSRWRRNCCENCDRVRDTWGRGLIQCGTLGPESMQYVAGYVMKKMTSIDDQRLHGRHPEFSRMSIGLGAGALENVADTLRALDLDITQADVPSALRHGNKLLPLGRYLRRKLRVLLGKDPNAPPETIAEMEKELRIVREISWNSQETGQFVPVSDLLREKEAQKLKNLEGRQRIFKQRKSL